MSLFQKLPRPIKTYHSTTYDRIGKHHGFDGQGKTVLITGGANGVGFSIAKAFAEAGVARVAIITRSPSSLEKAKADLDAAYPSTEILAYQASVTDSSRMADILQELGTVDVLVLNAAVAHRRAKATEITAQEMQDAFDTNVIAVFNLTKAYLTMLPLPPSGQKTIINVSAAALQVSGMRVGYASSKAAAAQVMQQFAADLEGDDVRIFSYHPGALYTPGVAQNFPKGTMEWEDIDLPAHFAVWLAGPESSCLHGRYMWANWDVDELIALKDKLENDPFYMRVGLVQ